MSDVQIFGATTSMITQEPTQTTEPVLDSLTTDEFLSVVGQRVRKQRAEKGMSRKRLAEVSGVSERYLAQLESGQGNMSIALLRKVTAAIGMSMGALMSAEITESKNPGVGEITLTPEVPAKPSNFGTQTDIVVEI